jgi:hypothetical protein
MILTVAKTGRVGEKVYVAKLTGLDAKFVFARMFCELFRDEGGSRKSWTESTRELQDGVYEIAEAGDRDYRIIWTDGSVQKTCTITIERATRIAEGMDAGMSFSDARLASKNAVAS